jgi:hypothetical protein
MPFLIGLDSRNFVALFAAVFAKLFAAGFFVLAFI